MNIERKSISYVGMEQTVLAHQEARAGESGFFRVRRGDVARVAPDTFSDIKYRQADGQATTLMSPIESRRVIRKLQHNGVLDKSGHIVWMAGVDGALASVRLGLANKAPLSQLQQDHVRFILRTIRNHYSDRRQRAAISGLTEHVERLSDKLKGLNKKSEKLL